jgi:hypothetical protein
VTAGPLAETDTIADQHYWIVSTCQWTERALADALRAQDMESIVLLKAGAETTHERTVREHMPEQVQLTAGQAAGTIRRHPDTKVDLPSPSEVSGVRSKAGIHGLYVLADNVPDELFLAAIAAARNDHVMSRAAVARKIAELRDAPAGRPAGWVPSASDTTRPAAARRRELIAEYAGQGYSSQQIRERLGGTTVASIRRIARQAGVTLHADAVVTRARRPDSLRVGRETVTALEALADGLPMIDLAQIGPAEAKTWAESIEQSLTPLRQFAVHLRRIA